MSDGSQVDRLEAMADILYELLDLTPGTVKEIHDKIEVLRGEAEWRRA